MESYKIVCIKECGNVDGVNYVYGRYSHYVPNCENVLIVDGVIYPVHNSNTDNIEDIVRDIICRQKRL